MFEYLDLSFQELRLAYGALQARCDKLATAAAPMRSALEYAAKECQWAAQRFAAQEMNVDQNTMNDVSAKARAALAAARGEG